MPQVEESFSVPLVFSAFLASQKKKSRNISFIFFSFSISLVVYFLFTYFLLFFAVIYELFPIPFSIFDTARHSTSYVGVGCCWVARLVYRVYVFLTGLTVNTLCAPRLA